MVMFVLQLFCYSLSADDSTTFRMKVTSEAEHFTDLSKVSLTSLLTYISGVVQLFAELTTLLLTFVIYFGLEH